MTVEGQERLESVNAIRAHQRVWLADARERAEKGEPFAICTSDEFEEILKVFGIPVIVINYWNFVISAQRKSKHLSEVLAARGYPGPHFFALGWASAIDPANAPWGGLPKPAIILGATRSEAELRISELWAREYGCPVYPLDFNFASPFKQIPPEDWWARLREEWPALVDPARLELRLEQLKSLISYLELLTGRSLSQAGLRRAMELVNLQMDTMTRARDVIARARPCPITLRDQISAYQTNWHRGTEKGLELATAYLRDLEDRVARGVGAYRNERYRALFWSMNEVPEFSEWLETTHGAVFVGGPFGAMPQTYARTVHGGDALRTLAGRYIFLFDLQSPSWMLNEAKVVGADFIVVPESPSPYPSYLRRAAERAGIPFLSVPRTGDDEETRGLISAFIRTLPPKG